MSNFKTSIVAKHQKIEGGHFDDFLRKKSLNAEKTECGDPLVSYVTRKKRKNLFGSVP